jgi:putative CocE/NonD family hydrolase
MREDRVVRSIDIPARDGLELSANLFLPAGRGPGARWPVVLNMDPYRKDDWSAGWDRSLGTYLAEHGFAYCRLDVRGTGSSPGVALDEYTETETDDGYAAVEWLAGQPWCTGAVGMWGLSYGGFTALQVAALRPPHLRAIVPIQATDDRYTDDVHYVGGAMTVSELAQYAVSQVAMNALPPSPEAWGDGWRERWHQRLEATPVWLLEWARRQRDGAYWRRGSLAPDYERISAAILQLGGWMDEYVDAALRIQARCTAAAARRTIVGPWVHGLPDRAYPGPNIDWLHELVRWFDHWLRGIDNGVEAEPALTWFRREFTPPERFPKRLNGSWQALRAWPDGDATPLTLALLGADAVGRGRLAAPADGADVRAADVRAADDADARAADRPGARAVDGADRLEHHPTAGVRAGSLCWGAGHPPNGLAADLRLEEPYGLVYTSAPLEGPLDVLGAPLLVLHVVPDTPVAHVVARLGDVAPDGAVEQVCEGLLNLTHRDSHAEPTPLRPGRGYEIRLALRSAGHRFLPGHRLRLSLATAHWPVAWPAPGPASLAILRGPAHPSRLELPRAPTGTAVQPPAFKTSPPRLVTFGSEETAPPAWTISDDRLAETVTVSTWEASTSTLADGRSTLYLSEALAMTASERKPGSGRFANTCEYRLTRDGLAVLVVADGTTIADADGFDMTGGLRVELDGEPFFEGRWQERIPRDLL